MGSSEASWSFSTRSNPPLLVPAVRCSEKGFKHTFYQTTRAREYNKALFDTGDDEYRMSVFTDHPSYYQHYEKELKEWLAEVWDDLHSSKPSWFTEEAISKIPIRLIPNIDAESVREEMGDEGKNKRATKESLSKTIGQLTMSALQIGRQ